MGGGDGGGGDGGGGDGGGGDGGGGGNGDGESGGREGALLKREVASGSSSTSSTFIARLLLAVLGSLMASTRAASARSASLCEGNVTSTVTATVARSRRRIEVRGGAVKFLERWRRPLSLVIVTAAASTAVRPAAARIESTASRSAASFLASADAMESLKVVW